MAEMLQLAISFVGHLVEPSGISDGIRDKRTARMRVLRHERAGRVDEEAQLAPAMRQEAGTGGSPVRLEETIKHRMILGQLLARPALRLPNRSLLSGGSYVAGEQVHHPKHLGRQPGDERRSLSELALQLCLKLALAHVRLAVESLVEFGDYRCGPDRRASENGPIFEKATPLGSCA
jgi:hypothetical protein